MSLLTICQNVTDEIGIAKPTSIIGNTSDENAVRMLAIAQRAGKTLATRNWSVLQSEHTFATVSGTASYSFPSDFARFLPHTSWNRTDYRWVRGSVTAQEWQWRKSGISQSRETDQVFMIRADSGERKFFIDPTPTAAETIAYEYISNAWCEDSGGTGQSAWAADGDVARLDEYLIELDVKWRLLRSLGLDYGEEKYEAEREVDKAFARDKPGEMLDMSVGTKVVGIVNLPETGYGGV